MSENNIAEDVHELIVTALAHFNDTLVTALKSKLEDKGIPFYKLTFEYHEDGRIIALYKEQPIISWDPQVINTSNASYTYQWTIYREL